MLVVQHRRLDLLELRLQEILHRLDLHPVAAHLELRVDAPEELHLLGPEVDPAAVSGAVEPAEAGMGDELPRRLLREVAVAARDVHAADAELSLLAVEQRQEAADLEDDVADVGKGGADGDRLSGSQALAARVGAGLGGAVGVDDLPPATGPRLDERRGERLARGNDVAADRVGEIELGRRRERGQERRRTEEHGDLGLAQDGDELRAGPDLLLGQQHHGAPRHPGAVHLGDAAVVSQRRRERGRVHPRNEIEEVRVGQREIHVAGVRTLHSLGHPGGAAGVEEGGEAFSRVVEPGWRQAARCSTRAAPAGRSSAGRESSPARA